MRFTLLLLTLFLCSCSLTQFKEWAIPEVNQPSTIETARQVQSVQSVQAPLPEIVEPTPSIKEKYSCPLNASSQDAINFISRYSEATYHEQNALNEETVALINEELMQFVDDDYIQKHYLYKSLYVFPYYDEHSETPEVTCVEEKGKVITVHVALMDDNKETVQVKKFTLKRDIRGILSIVPQQPPGVVPKGIFSAEQERTNWSPRLYLQVPEVVYQENLHAQLQ